MLLRHKTAPNHATLRFALFIVYVYTCVIQNPKIKTHNFKLCCYVSTVHLTKRISLALLSYVFTRMHEFCIAVQILNTLQDSECH